VNGEPMLPVVIRRNQIAAQLALGMNNCHIRRTPDSGRNSPRRT
jgi:hypothetical protein